MSPGTASPAPPSPADLARTLGRAAAHWSRLHAAIAAEFGPLEETWSLSKKTGRWALRLRQRRTKRTVITLVAAPGHLLAAFALGEKACRAAASIGLPAAWLEAIEQAPRYAEGRGVWLEVRTAADAANARKLAAARMSF